MWLLVLLVSLTVAQDCQADRHNDCSPPKLVCVGTLCVEQRCTLSRECPEYFDRCLQFYCNAESMRCDVRRCTECNRTTGLCIEQRLGSTMPPKVERWPASLVLSLCIVTMLIVFVAVTIKTRR